MPLALAESRFTEHLAVNFSERHREADRSEMHDRIQLPRFLLQPRSRLRPVNALNRHSVLLDEQHFAKVGIA